MPISVKDDPDPEADCEAVGLFALAEAEPVVPVAEPVVVDPATLEPLAEVDPPLPPPIIASVSTKLPVARAVGLVELPLVPVTAPALLDDPELRQPVTTTSFLLVFGLLPICPFAS